MIQIRTRPINTHALRASTDSSALSSLPKGLSRMSSMRATLNSKYCLRAQMLARRLGNSQANGQASEEFFSYQEGQHHVKRAQHQTVPDNQEQKNNGDGKFHLPEEVKITTTKSGKRWSTSSMRVELADDILEVRDGLGKIVDAFFLKRT